MSRLEKHCLFCMANSCQSAHAARHIKEGLVCFGPWQNRKKQGATKVAGSFIVKIHAVRTFFSKKKPRTQSATRTFCARFPRSVFTTNKP